MYWVRSIVAITACWACCSAADAGVISYWRFEEGSGPTATDQTGLANAQLKFFPNTSAGAGDSGEAGWSTNISSSSVPQTGLANLSSLHFAQGPHLVLSPSDVMDLGSSFTLEFYFSLDTLPVVNSPYVFLSFSDFESGLSLRVGQLPLSGFRLQAVGATALNAEGVPLLANTWYHLALVHTSASAELFLNGSLLVSGNSIGTDFNFASSGNYFIGTDNFSGGFDGFLDEIRISDEALAPSQFLNAIPEPSTLALTAAALVLLTGIRRRSQCDLPR